MSAIGTPEEEGFDPKVVDMETARRDEAIAVGRQLQEMSSESAQDISTLRIPAWIFLITALFTASLFGVCFA